jgi:hypothetical protein
MSKPIWWPITNGQQCRKMHQHVFLHYQDTSFGGSRGFGSMKWSANIVLGLKGDSHKHDCVNFFWPKANAMSSGFTNSNVDVSNSSGIVKDEAIVLTFQGLKVQECVCGDGVYVENWKVPTIIKYSFFAFKKIWWSIATPKSLQEEQFVAHLVYVMMLCNLIWKGLH